MTVAAGDFFEVRREVGAWGDEFKEHPDRNRIAALIDGPENGVPDLDMALALMDLVRDDLARSGTGGGELLTNADMRVAIRALTRVSSRAGFDFTLPFRDHDGWRGWWNRNGAYGSWQARRDLLSDLFDQSYAAMLSAHDRSLDATLLETVTPHAALGWPEIDNEVSELRRHFRTATTPQDYAAVGLDCVRVTEALSRKVYNHAVHGRPGEEEPPVAKTKDRLTRYVEARLAGPDNEALPDDHRTRSGGEALRPPRTDRDRRRC